jgi:gluconokinase
LAWFRRTQPQVWRAAARWLMLGEYLELRLLGRCRMSYSAAAWGGLLDRRRLCLDAPLLDLLGVAPGQLSPLADSDDPLTGLAGEYAARWPALRAVPWFAAVGDGAAANVGSGCTSHDRMALTVGTTGAVRVVHDETVDPVAAVPPGLWCYRVDRRHALLGGATSEGGNVYAWVRSICNLGAAADVEAALSACPPDGHGLTVLPFVAGERSPGWAGNVRATIDGLSLATTPIAILRAALEAVAYRFALIERRLCGRPGCPHRPIASGSALLSSPAWMQIFADVVGKPVVASREQEATSRGVALLALRGLGAISSFADAPAADGRVFEPDAGRHAVYQAAISRQQDLYDRLIRSRAR